MANKDIYTKLDTEIKDHVNFFLDRRNKLMLEACISAFMDTHTPEETAKILREFADQLEMYR